MCFGVLLLWLGFVLCLGLFLCGCFADWFCLVAVLFVLIWLGVDVVCFA